MSKPDQTTDGPRELKARQTEDQLPLSRSRRLSRALIRSNAASTAHIAIAAAPRFFREHPAVLFTAAYAYTSVLGFFYMRSLFGAFGLNVMEFVDVTSLFLAAFKKPAIVSALVGLVAGYLTGFLATSPLWRRIHNYAEGMPDDLGQAYLAFSRTVMIGIPAVAAVAFSLVWAQTQGLGDANRILLGEAPTIVVELRSSVDSPAASRLEHVTMLGTTASFAFFYDRGSHRTHVIPLANIQQMQVVPEAEAQPLTTPTTPP
jgi:hypothetical protein